MPSASVGRHRGGKGRMVRDPDRGKGLPLYRDRKSAMAAM
jgi:hypothetical protein